MHAIARFACPDVGYGREVKHIKKPSKEHRGLQIHATIDESSSRKRHHRSGAGPPQYRRQANAAFKMASALARKPWFGVSVRDEVLDLGQELVDMRAPRQFLRGPGLASSCWWWSRQSRSPSRSTRNFVGCPKARCRNGLDTIGPFGRVFTRREISRPSRRRKT